MKNMVLVTLCLLKALSFNSLKRFLVHGIIKNINGSVLWSNKGFWLCLLKLEFYGVKGSILNLLKSYLHNRKQRVVLQFVNLPNLISDWETDTLFLRDLLWAPYFSTCILMIFLASQTKVFHTILFADDTNILVSSSDLNQLNSKLNSVVYCIFKWFQNNQLVLKTHIVKFTSSKLLTYPLHNAYNSWTLTVSENITFLGMHLDCHLSWKSHVDNLVKKLSSICLMLRKLLPTVNVNILQMAYFAHFC